MPLVSYSPWADAANATRGIGDSVAQALLQKQKLQQQLTMAPIQGAQARADLNYTQAGTGSLNARASLYKAQQMLAQQGIGFNEEDAKRLQTIGQLVQGGDARGAVAQMIMLHKSNAPLLDALSEHALPALTSGIDTNPNLALAKELGASAKLGPGQVNAAAGLSGPEQFHNVPAGNVAMQGDQVVGYGLPPTLNTPPGYSVTQGGQVLGTTAPKPVASKDPNELMLQAMGIASRMVDSPNAKTQLGGNLTNLRNYAAGVTNFLPKASAPQGGLPHVSTKEQFDALPSGTRYTEDDGQTYIKP